MPIQLGPVIGTLTDFSPSAGDEIDNVYTVKNANINVTLSGDTTIVALVSGKKIRVISYGIRPVSAATNISWKSGASTTKIPVGTYAINEGEMSGNLLPGWFMETDSGEALVLNSSATANISGFVNYIEV